MLRTSFKTVLSLTCISLFHVSLPPVSLDGGRLAGQDKPVPDQLAQFDPAGLVRFHNLAQASKKRNELIRFVWASGLPTGSLPRVKQGLPKDIFAKELLGIDPQHAKSVSRLTCEVAPFDFESTCFLIHSKRIHRNNRRLVIVHSGHRRGVEIGEGVDSTIEKMLEKGFQVLVVDMPLVGWNTDRQVKIPAKETVDPPRMVNIGNRGTASHNDLFRQLGPPVLPQGTVFRFFVEPVVQGINYFRHSTREPVDVSMVGLSGGGWATHFCAAVDVRIKTSFPVAGAMPLYARKFSPGSWGDAEQYYEPVYGESDSNGDGVTDQATGVASWLEIFALGGIGKKRFQLQVLNYSDPCCFGTNVYKTYDTFVSGKVEQLGGRWKLYSDRSHQKHVISREALERIVNILQP